MNDLLQKLGEQIGQFFDSPVVRTGVQLIAIYFVLLWAATAYWALPRPADSGPRSARALPGGGDDHPVHAAAVPLRLDHLPHRPATRDGRRGQRTAARRRGDDGRDRVAAALRELLAGRSTRTGSSARPAATDCAASAPTAAALVELDWSLCAWCGKDFERPELLQEVAVRRPPAGPSAPPRR